MKSYKTSHLNNSIHSKNLLFACILRLSLLGKFDFLRWLCLLYDTNKNNIYTSCVWKPQAYMWKKKRGENGAAQSNCFRDTRKETIWYGNNGRCSNFSNTCATRSISCWSSFILPFEKSPTHSNNGGTTGHRGRVAEYKLRASSRCRLQQVIISSHCSWTRNVEIVNKLFSVAPKMCWWLDDQGMNPIHIAAMRGQVGVLEVLLEHDLSPARERLHRGQTVLHLCAKHGATSCTSDGWWWRDTLRFGC